MLDVEVHVVFVPFPLELTNHLVSAMVCPHLNHCKYTLYSQGTGHPSDLGGGGVSSFAIDSTVEN